MGMQGDEDEITPAPLRITKQVDLTDRTPYIPRRKSSINSGQGPQAVYSTSDLDEPLAMMDPVGRRPRVIVGTLTYDTVNPIQSGAVEIQRPRFPIDGYDSVPQDRSLMQTMASGQRKTSAGRRFVKRVCSNTTAAIRRVSDRSTSSRSTVGIGRELGRELEKRDQQSLGNPQMSRLNSLGSASVSSSVDLPPGTMQPRVFTNMYIDSTTQTVNPLHAPPEPHGAPFNSEILANHRCYPEPEWFSTPIPDNSVFECRNTPTIIAQIHLDILNIKMSLADMKTGLKVWVFVDITCHALPFNYSGTSAANTRRISQNEFTFLKDLKLKLLARTGCKILSRMGPLERKKLHDGCTWTTIAQLRIDPLQQLEKFGSSSVQDYEDDELAFPMKRRSTSQVLMQNLQTMLHLKSKVKQAAETDIILASLEHGHASLPDWNPAVCQVACNIAGNNFQYDGFDSRHKTQDPDYDALINAGAVEEAAKKKEERICNGVLRVLEEAVHTHSPIFTTHPSQAVQLLDDFVATAKYTSARTLSRMQTLRNSYQERAKRGRDRSPPLTKRRSAFDKTRAGEQQDLMEALGMSDITNQNRYRGHDKLSPKAIKTASPQSTPAKRTSNAQYLEPSIRTLDGTDDSYDLRKSHREEMVDLNLTKLNDGHNQTAGKRVFGGEYGYMVPASLATAERLLGDEEDGDGVEEARKIWEKMRVSSGRSIGSWGRAVGQDFGGLTLSGGEEEDLQEERFRQMEVLGAPWL